MEYKDINDYEMLYLISENEEDAYNMIYYKYRPIISRMASKFSRKFHNIGIEYDDLYQEGMYGLSEAVNRFDFNNNNLFYTFALVCIKREMQRLIIKSLRYKNNILNNAYSIEDEVSNDGLLLIDTLYNCDMLVENHLENINITKYLNQIKYYLKDKQMPVYELKLNGFSNSDIAILLDMSYKDVDNCLYSIKKILKKVIFQLDIS